MKWLGMAGFDYHSMLQAQKQHAAYRDVASDRLATAKAQAQDYAQSAQQKAADHMDRVGASSQFMAQQAVNRPRCDALLLHLCISDKSPCAHAGPQCVP